MNERVQLGPPDRLSVLAGHAAGWLINLAVAEWAIHRPAANVHPMFSFIWYR
jgi:hypothetical protein